MQTPLVTAKLGSANARAPYRKFLTVVFLLALSGWALGAGAESEKSQSAQFEGSFDKLEVGTLGGWAWNGARPNTPIPLEIYDGARLLATVTADGFREDLKSAGKGDGKHAFNYALPKTLRDDQSHTISIRYAGTPIDLSGSPKTLFFPKS